MKKAAFLANLFFSCLSMAATPIDGVYSQAFGGSTYLPGNTQFDNHAYGIGSYQPGFDAGGSLGFKNNPLRYEGEVTYLKANVNRLNPDYVYRASPSGYSDAIFGMANVYYDFPKMNATLQPFLGAGVGYGWVHATVNPTRTLNLGNFNAENSTFAYQATGGVTYNFAENYALSLGYRYIGTSNLSEFGQIFQAHIANFGAIYRFDGNKYK